MQDLEPWHGEGEGLRRDRWALPALLAVLVVYFASRLSRLLDVPLFIDEAFHIERAKWAAAGRIQTGAATGRWASIQTYGLWMRVFGDSVFAARLLPVLLGAATVVILYLTARSFDSERRPWLGLLAAMLYVVSPLALFYDRLALVDEFVTFLLAVLILLTLDYAAHRRRTDLAAIYAIVVLAPLFKMNAVLLLPVPLFVLTATGGLSLMKRKDVALPYAVAAFLLVPMSLIYARLDHTTVADKTNFVGGFAAIGARMLGNVGELTRISWHMLTGPILVAVLLVPLLALMNTFALEGRFRPLGLFAVVAWLGLSQAILLAVLPSRWLMPLVVPATLVLAEGAALGWTRVRQARRPLGLGLLAGVVVLTLAVPTASSVRLLVSPATFPLSAYDHWLFYTSYASGYGLRRLVGDVHRLSDARDITLLESPNAWGLSAYYRELGPRVHAATVDNWGEPGMLASVQYYLGQERPVYLVTDSAAPGGNEGTAVAKLSRRFRLQLVGYYPRHAHRAGRALWLVHARAE